MWTGTNEISVSTHQSIKVLYRQRTKEKNTHPRYRGKTTQTTGCCGRDDKDMQ